MTDAQEPEGVAKQIRDAAADAPIEVTFGLVEETSIVSDTVAYVVEGALSGVGAIFDGISFDA